jgi:hypothetical protein
MSGLDNAWLPYYCKTLTRYNKVKHLDNKKEIIKKINYIYRCAGLMPLFTTYKDLDNVNEKINFFYSKL